MCAPIRMTAEQDSDAVRVSNGPLGHRERGPRTSVIVTQKRRAGIDEAIQILYRYGHGSDAGGEPGRSADRRGSKRVEEPTGRPSTAGDQVYFHSSGSPRVATGSGRTALRLGLDRPWIGSSRDLRIIDLHGDRVTCRITTGILGGEHG